MVGGCLKPSRFSQSIVSVIHILQRLACVRRGRSGVPSPLAGEGQGEGKSSGNASTHPNEKCCSVGHEHKFRSTENRPNRRVAASRPNKDAVTTPPGEGVEFRLPALGLAYCPG